MQTDFAYDITLSFARRHVLTASRSTGKERDAESGLDYFGARYYGSMMGRWMSTDLSLDSAIMELPQTWNKYSYVYNRPTFATDPDGRCPPCIGAVVGGVVEGGWNLTSQLMGNGGHLGSVNWGQVGANAAGGAVAGATAGATGGASLLVDAAVGAGANVAGGVVTRGLDSTVDPDDVLNTGEISADAVSGFIGGGVGHIASDLVHEPQDIGPRPENGRRRLAKYDANAAREAKLRNTAFGVGTAAGSPPSHGVLYVLHHPIAIWNWLFFPPPPPPPEPRYKVTVTILNSTP